MCSIVPSPPSEITRSRPGDELLGVDTRGARARPPPPRHVGTRTSTSRSRNHAAAVCASACASARSRCGTRPTAPRARSRGHPARRPRSQRSAASIVIGAATRVGEELDVAVGAGDRRRDQARARRARARRGRRRLRSTTTPRARRGRGRSRPCRHAPGPPRTAASRAGRSRRSAVVSASRCGATVRSEMNDTSTTQRSGGGSSASGSTSRARWCAPSR